MQRCEQELPDFQLAFELAIGNASNSLAQALAYRGYLLTSRVGRLAEGLEICERIRRLAEQQQDGAAFHYAIEMADAMSQAHRYGVVRRDLKPGNIILTKAGTKLLDFGLAKVRLPKLSSE